MQAEIRHYPVWEDFVIEGYWIMMQVAPGQWVSCRMYEATIH